VQRYHVGLNILNILFLLIFLFIYFKKKLIKHLIKLKTVSHRFTNTTRSTKMSIVQ